MRAAVVICSCNRPESWKCVRIYFVACRRPPWLPLSASRTHSQCLNAVTAAAADSFNINVTAIVIVVGHGDRKIYHIKIIILLFKSSISQHYEYDHAREIKPTAVNRPEGQTGVNVLLQAPIDLQPNNEYRFFIMVYKKTDTRQPLSILFGQLFIDGRGRSHTQTHTKARTRRLRVELKLFVTII